MKIQTYLINLDSSHERLAQADQQLVAYNLPYQRVSAVDGRQLDVHTYTNYDSKKAHALMGRDLLGAEIGCYLSHLRCVETFLASDADFAIVLEDDLRVDHDFMQDIQQSIEWLNQHQYDWYLMNIGTNKKKFSKLLQLFRSHQLRKSYYFPVLTLGLVWSRRGAQQFLNDQTKIATPIDVTLQSWLTANTKGLSFYPALIVPCGAQSDIDAGHKIETQQHRQRIGKRWPRQKRMWQNKWLALRHQLVGR